MPPSKEFKACLKEPQNSFIYCQSQLQLMLNNVEDMLIFSQNVDYLSVHYTHSALVCPEPSIKR